MTEDQVSPASRTSKWLIPVVGLTLVAISIVTYMYRQNSRSTPIEKAAASYLQVSPEDLHDLGQICDRVQKTHLMSEADWQYVKNAFRNDNEKILAIGPLSFVRSDFPHKPEAVAMLQQYLSEGHTDGKVVAAIGLKRLGDPSWEDAAQSLMNSDNSSTRDAAKRVFGKK